MTVASTSGTAGPVDEVPVGGASEDRGVPPRPRAEHADVAALQRAGAAARGGQQRRLAVERLAEVLAGLRESAAANDRER
jgi:hypothetical protein